MANGLNTKGAKPTQSETWTRRVIYCLRLRLRHFSLNAHILRTYSDAQFKEQGCFFLFIETDWEFLAERIDDGCAQCLRAHSILSELEPDRCPPPVMTPSVS